MGAAGQALTASLAVTTSRASADLTRCRIPTALLDGAAYPGQLAEQLDPSPSTASQPIGAGRSTTPCPTPTWHVRHSVAWQFSGAEETRERTTLKVIAPSFFA